MKKLLLFALAAGMGLSTYAQTNKKYEVSKVDRPVPQTTIFDMNTAAAEVHPVATDVQLPNPKGTRNIQQVQIGKSGPWGVYSVLLGSQVCLSYEPSLDLLAFTHRGEENEYPASNNSTIMASWSSNNGVSFDNHIIVVEGSDDERNRYPSGVLYNPAGNTDPNQAFIVTAGPALYDADGWNGYFFGTANLDGSNANTEFVPYAGGNQNALTLLRNSLDVTDNGDAFTVDRLVEENSEGYPIADYELLCLKGTKSGSSWSWERKTQPVEFTVDNAGGGTLNCSFKTSAAFAKDGSIGYMWGFGQAVSAAAHGGIQPVVYYTEDAGESWNPVSVNLENHEGFQNYLAPTNQGTGPIWPLITGRESVGVVDANGNLQMFTKVKSHSTTHPDSVWYGYNGELNLLYNLTFSKTGVESAIFVDSIMGNEFNQNTAPQYCFGGADGAGWDNRIQASISEDGQVIAVSWGDTPTAQTNYEGYNAAPDIKGTARRINSNDFYRDEVDSTIPNFTENDIYTGTYRFTYAARTGKLLNNTDEGAQLLVPMSTSVSLPEFEGGSAQATITHSLLTTTINGGKDRVPGIAVPVREGVQDMATVNNNAFTVSQNQPNPFTGTTTITVNSNTVAPVSVEVSNIMGQTVFTQNEGTVNGSKKITIDASNLQAGIYFYTVRVGSESQTKKMMVK